MRQHPLFYALAAIVLWASLATLGASVAALPPFFTVGVSLMVGSLCAIRHWRQWRVPPATLLLGVVGLFGYHFFLFVAFRLAPAVEANLLNYLWPLLIVLLSPVLLPGYHLNTRHILGALAGFVGARWWSLAASSASTSPPCPAMAALHWPPCCGPATAADQTRAGFSHRRHRRLLPALRRAVAGLPRTDGTRMCTPAPANG